MFINNSTRDVLATIQFNIFKFTKNEPDITKKLDLIAVVDNGFKTMPSFVKKDFCEVGKKGKPFSKYLRFILGWELINQPLLAGNLRHERCKRERKSN